MVSIVSLLLIYLILFIQNNYNNNTCNWPKSILIINLIFENVNILHKNCWKEQAVSWDEPLYKKPHTYNAEFLTITGTSSLLFWSILIRTNLELNKLVFINFIIFNFRFTFANIFIFLIIYLISKGQDAGTLPSLWLFLFVHHLIFY